MRPITFVCRKLLHTSAADIAAQIADVSRWREFEGYGILPGIAKAEYETQTANMLGSRIRVLNRDGSHHCEEICEWNPDQRIVIKLCEFTPPVNRLATHFLEEWDFETQNGGTLVSRTLKLFPKHAGVRPILWLISLVLKRAILRHLTEMDRESINRRTSY